MRSGDLTRSRDHEVVGVHHLGLLFLFGFLFGAQCLCLLQLVDFSLKLPECLDEEGHGEVHQVVSPGQLHDYVRSRSKQQ